MFKPKRHCEERSDEAIQAIDLEPLGNSPGLLRRFTPCNGAEVDLSFLRNWVLILLLIFFPITSYAIPKGDDCSLVKNAMLTASRIRRLRSLETVSCKMQNKAQVEQYLRDFIKRKIPADKLKNEEHVYRLLGMIPFDFDYVNGIIQLYTSQLGGYYDAEKNYYVMADWMPSIMQLPIAVHELTHALQDQHFKLDSVLDQDQGTSDALIARSALIEGDATAVMIDYSNEIAGKESVAKSSSVSSFMAQNLAGMMLSPGMRSAPQALQAMMIFPYMSGLNFAHVLLKRGGYQEIDSAFKNWPKSTEEILHPEKYFSKNQDFQVVEIEKFVDKDQFSFDLNKPTYLDTMGEFAISTLLGNWLPPLEASEAAAGWGGDMLALYGKTLIWVTLWDTDSDANEFFEGLSKAYQRRFGGVENRDRKQVKFRLNNEGNVRVDLFERRVDLVIENAT